MPTSSGMSIVKIKLVISGTYIRFKYLIVSDWFTKYLEVATSNKVDAAIPKN